MSTDNNQSILASMQEKLLDAKDAVVEATTGVQPVNRHAPQAPEQPPVAQAQTSDSVNLQTAVEAANSKLESKNTYIPPAQPHQQLMMDKLHALGVVELGRDLFYYRQYFTEDEIAEYWKEFNTNSGADSRVTVGDLTRIGGRRPEFEEVRKALAGLSAEHTLSFGQFLGLLKKSRNLDGQGEKLLQRERVHPIGSGIHGTSEEELYVLMHFVNLLLERDDTVCGILPLDDKSPEVFKEFADGGLFCKLINRIKPGTIDEGVFHFGEGLHFLQLMDNQVINLKAARSIGANVDSIDPEGLLSGQPRQVLAFLEQLFRLTFGTGSRSYNNEETERQSKFAFGSGILGAPTEPGVFIPADMPRQATPASEDDLISKERQAGIPPDQERLVQMQQELEAARLAAERHNDQMASMQKSYQELLLQVNQKSPAIQSQGIRSPALHSAVLGTLSPISSRRAVNPAPAPLSAIVSSSPYSFPSFIASRDIPIATTTAATPAPATTFITTTPVMTTTTPVMTATTPVMTAMTPVMTAMTPVATATAPVVAIVTPVVATTAPTTTLSTAGAPSVAPKRAGEALVKGILRWKRRYIALDNNWLYIYKNSGVNSSNKHSINLTGAQVTLDTDASREHAIFVNNVQQHEKAHLSFANDAQMKEWLRDLANSQKYFALNPPTPSPAAINTGAGAARTYSQGAYPTTQSQGSYPNSQTAYQAQYSHPAQGVSQPAYVPAGAPYVYIPQGTTLASQGSTQPQVYSQPYGQYQTQQYQHQPGTRMIRPTYTTPTVYNGGQMSGFSQNVTSATGSKLDLTDPNTLRSLGLSHLINPNVSAHNGANANAGANFNK